MYFLFGLLGLFLRDQSSTSVMETSVAVIEFEEDEFFSSIRGCWAGSTSWVINGIGWGALLTADA